MIEIKAIASYLPNGRTSNLALMEQFDVDESFLASKIGVLERAHKDDSEETSDMALKALENLLTQTNLAREDIQVLIVVTQNPDTNLPHVSGLVHGKAKLTADCAAFDISLGCSGYVYGLSIIKSFMDVNGLTCGVLITCDPYSKIIDQSDKSTALLFGDAATATLMGKEPVMACGPFLFGTQGDLIGSLECRNGTLQMNGREVFNFAATVVPKHIEKLLVKADIQKEDIDCYLFHQGSRYIVETLAKRLGLDHSKVRFGIEQIGNTVSSSIPLLLEHELKNKLSNKILLCGFGVGLSWASCICERKGN